MNQPSLSSLGVALRRAALLLAMSLSAGATGAGCDDGEASDLAPIEPGEWLPGGDTTNTLLLGINAFSRHVENITLEHERMFFSGNALFNEPWVEAPASTGNRDGLGPLFNARSCSACHARDGRGLPPDSPDASFLGLLVRVSVPGEDVHGGPLADARYGGQLQPFALPNVPVEAALRVLYTEVPGQYDDGTPYTLLEPTYAIDSLGYGEPEEPLLLSPRIAPQVIGLALLEAIPTERLEALADADDDDNDGISGRLNYVWDEEAQAMAVGRFGWKSEQPTVRQQTAGAFLGDMGITTPVFPEQNCTASQPECAAAIAGGEPEIDDRLFDRVVLYSSLLAVPVRRDWEDTEVRRGKQLFADAGCIGCHVSRHETGPHAFEEVADQVIWPYTDLLLHDMGPALSDGRPVYSAGPSEWRTPPLWGVGLFTTVNGDSRLMHDGRARGVAEAILWHGGEADASRAAFTAMSATERAALVRFVESL